MNVKRVNIQSASCHYRYFNFLAIMYVTILLSTIPITYKIVTVGSATASAAVFYMPVFFTLGDVIAEVYGYQLSRQLLWCALFADFIFAVLDTIAIHLPSISTPHMQSAFNMVLGHSLHGVVGGMSALLVGAFVNVYLITKWKLYTKGKYFWLRSLGATAVGEAIVYTIGNLVAFGGVVPLLEILKVIITMYIFQLIYSGIMVWPAAFLAHILKKKEYVDVYDYNTNFNPFKFHVENKSQND